MNTRARILLLAALAALPFATAAAPGDLDPGFGTNGVVEVRIGQSDDIATALVLRADGKLVAVGRAGDDAALARYLADGSLDATFGKGGKAVFRLADSSLWPTGAVEQPDGKIVVLAGAGINAPSKVLRFNADGSHDPSLDHAAANFPANVFFSGTPGLALQADGKILVSIHGPGTHFGAIRLLPTGHVDAAFGSGGMALADAGATNRAAGLVVQPDGRIIVATTLDPFTSSPQVTAVRFNADGTRDLTFAMPNSPGGARTVALQSDGKLLIAGCGITQPSMLQNVLAWRTLANGAPDTGFGGPTGRAIYISPQCPTGIAVRSDGRIAITTAHPAELLVPTTASEIIMLHPNGFTDASNSAIFRPMTSYDMARAIVVRPDDQLVVAGDAARRDFALQRFTTAVDVDPSFGNAGAVKTEFMNGRAGSITGMRRANGKLVVAVNLNFTSRPDGTTNPEYGGLARVLADGTMDPTFGNGGQLALPYYVHAFVVLPDDRIVVANAGNDGQHGYSRTMLIRFNPDGTEDPTFGLREVPHGWASSLELQPDGRMVLAGANYQAPDQLFIARVLADGTADSSFGSGGVVRYPRPYAQWTGTTKLAIEPDGKIVVGDVMTTPFSAMRLNPDGSHVATWIPFTPTPPEPQSTRLASVLVHGDGHLTLAGTETGRATVCGGYSDGNAVAFGRILETIGGGYLAGGLAPNLHPSIRGARLDAADRVVASGTRHVNCMMGVSPGEFFSRTGAIAMRFTPSGALDTRFGAGGVVTLVANPRWQSSAGDPAVEPTGRIVVPVASSTGFAGRFTLFGLQGGGDSEPIGPPQDIDADSLPNFVEQSEGLDPFVRDNDVFASARLFVMQQYRDFLDREGDANGIVSWTNFMTGGENRATVADSFLRSAEFEGNIAPVTRLYFAYFLRIPDYSGLRYWMGRARLHESLEDISQLFAASPEFVNTYGALDNAGFVDRVYRNVLGRAPDPGGGAYWTGRLDAGMTRGQMMVAFSESPEYRGLIANEVYVTMVYAGMMRRSPDPGGFAHWVSYLDAGNSGMALIDAFLAATEYRSRFLP